MITHFRPGAGLIVVLARVVGPLGRITLRLALDTGATQSLLPASAIASIGYDLALVSDRVHITTGSGVEHVPRVIVSSLTGLIRMQHEFRVVVHTLPPSAQVDGLLGLDFLRNQCLKIDFVRGTLKLT